MFFLGVIFSCIGVKWILIFGFIFIIVFVVFGGSLSLIVQLVGYCGGWGLGNVLFILIVFVVIVGVLVGGSV